MKIHIPKYLYLVLLSALAIGLVLVPSTAFAAPIASLGNIQGEVMVQVSGNDQWSTATQGQALNSGAGGGTHR
jgi:hypothetical protein